jgi:predicted PurR-regulated permease PerM
LSQPPTQRVSRIVVTAVLAGFAVFVLWDFLPSLIWATVFAIATWPLYSRFVRLVHGTTEHGTGAPLVFTLVIGALFLVPLVVIAVALGREVLFVARWIPTLAQTGLPVPDWLGDVPFAGHYLTQWWQQNLADPGDTSVLLGRFDRSVLIEWTRTLGTQLVRRSTVLIFTLLTLFFLYRDGVRIVRQLEAVALRLVGPSGRDVGVHMAQAVRGTVNGLVLVGLAEGAVLGIAYVAFGLPHPALFGGFTGIFAMIPFGAPVVFCIAALILVPQSGVVSALVLLGIGFFVVFVADHFVRPALIGGAVKLPFLWVLLGILGGLEAFGLLGLFLGPAIMAAAIALWREWVAAAEASPQV